MTTNVAPNKPIGNVIPTGVESVDPRSGIAHDIGACTYSVLSTSGTTTVVGGPCVTYGAVVTVLATSTGAIQILDGTNALGTATATAVGQVVQPSGSDLGIRCSTSLVIITTGTNANTWNILWD